MTGKQFELEVLNNYEYVIAEFDKDNYYLDDENSAKSLECRLNELFEENEQLKSQLRIYRRIASCSNCNYHTYDEFDNNDGSYDEFEVCRKGNDVTDRICEDWRELDV